MYLILLGLVLPINVSETLGLIMGFIYFLVALSVYNSCRASLTFTSPEMHKKVTCGSDTKCGELPKFINSCSKC